MSLIDGMKGLGDCIYGRAFLKQFTSPVYYATPWPQLVADLPNVLCVRPETTLRTQSKNIAAQTQWHTAPRGLPVRRIRYGAEGIIAGLTASFGIEPGAFDLPSLAPVRRRRPYVVVRPATVRSEWRADTRNPDPTYIAIAAAEAAARGYEVISVADLADGAEWALDPLPYADHRFHSGELPVTDLLRLVQSAAAVIGGVGWIVPAALAARVPTWIISGGQGGFNSPSQICPPDSTITFCIPDNFCLCRQKQHGCDKRISNYDAKFTAWADQFLPVVCGERVRLA